MKDGIILLNKPQNWTSADCVAVCRKALGISGSRKKSGDKRKIGHGGTLDPMATGLLPIFVGQATRIMEYLELDYKTYRCTALLGIRTDTQDIWGERIDTPSDMAEGLTESTVRNALMSFEGYIEQIPPMYSAVRVDGKRLYDYAHKGREIDAEKIKPRPVHIQKIEIEDIKLFDPDEKAGEQPGIGRVTFTCCCSKGTYIRTICADLGEKLGCGATMQSLERIAIGVLNLEQKCTISTWHELSISPEQVKTMSAEEIEARMVPADYPLVHLGCCEISEERAVYYSRGNEIWWTQAKVLSEPDIPESAQKQTGNCAGSGEGDVPRNARGRAYDCIYRVYEAGTGEFLGTGFYDKEKNKMLADKVFTASR